VGVRPAAGLRAGVGYRLVEVDLADRPAAVLQVRARRRRDRLYRGPHQADGMTAGEACQRLLRPIHLATAIDLN
jgi:hypothetical protein